MAQKNNNMLSPGNIRYSGFPSVNVSPVERGLSILIGLLFFIVGVQRRSLPGVSLLLAGAYLLLRGVLGHCYGYQMLGIDRMRRKEFETQDEPPPESVEEGDEVMEASWESYPASDSPAWTMGREERE